MSGTTFQPPATGGRMYGHYRVRTRDDGSFWMLGAGGMGVTFRATDTRLQVDVALKVIHPERIIDPDAQRLFLREARAAARVIHPNVAPVLFLNDEPGRVFYAMEFVDGVSLYTFLQERGPLPTAQALAFAEQIAAGLGAIHAQQLVHRDLKPANVMVMHYLASDPRARPLAASGGCALKIIDFGLARGVGDFAQSHDAPAPTFGFRGTVAYASPEQCEERADLDGRCDLYSLGCILWEMLTGAPPFVGTSHRELLNQQVQTEPPWKRLREFPEPVVEVLHRLLAKAREERFDDASQAVEALAAARAVCPALPAATQLQRPTSRPTLVRPRSSRRRLALAAGGLAGLAALLGGAAWYFWPREPEPIPARRGPDPRAAQLDSAEAARRRFIAVLPFSQRGDETNDFFTEGIHEDVLASLAKVRDLRVISRSSVARFRDTGGGLDVRQIGQDLGVGTVLQGSVRRQGSRVRVTMQLVDTRNGEQLWSESYDREITDVFEIQSAIAREITGALAASFSSREQQAVARRPTGNAAAYELFLQARAQHARAIVTKEKMYPIVELYEKAVQLDPQFALAHAMLARVQAEMYWFAVDPTPTRIERARQAAQRALKLQPELPEAHVAMGEIYYRQERNYEAALSEYRIALAIAPSNPFALEASALALRRLNRWEESLQNFRSSAELSPDDAQKHMALAEMLFVMRRFREADASYRRCVSASGNREWELNQQLCLLETHGDWSEYCRRVTQLLPQFTPETRFVVQTILRDFRGALESLFQSSDPEVRDVLVPVPRALFAGKLHRHLGNRTEARDEFARATEILQSRVQAQPENPILRMKLATALAGMLDREAALREGETALKALPESRDTVLSRAQQLEFALVCAEVGEPERACDLLEYLLSVEIKLTRNHLRYFPDYDVLRGHPRFERLVAGK
ncbi:MAG: protein kinase [Verrucomicrobia bacterium]|nr:protein kinase [Verrucomicrobiota bacterium]